jgi:hypothetical protein
MANKLNQRLFTQSLAVSPFRIPGSDRATRANRIHKTGNDLLL